MVLELKENKLKTIRLAQFITKKYKDCICMFQQFNNIYVKGN